MGIIKVTFTNETDLNKALDDRISLYNQRYIVEKYIAKPRVIRCMKCQRFGHIERLCHETAVCGKCGRQDHETNTCNEVKENYKCHHCKGNHATGDRECAIMKEKLQDLTNRRNGSPY